MLRFKNFILEGGNVKVGPKGSEISAAPFAVTAKNRGERKTDIHNSLGSIHDAFHKEHDEHLFGRNQQGLHSGNVYAGSTHDLMSDQVDHASFAKHKPLVGDVDVQVSPEHKDKLAATLSIGRRFGKYTVAGTKKHGNEISAVMKHDNGEHHQFDFQGVSHPGSEANQFLHSSNWEDTKAGIKGAHHKILINAIGGDTHKFSITHGLRSRTDASDPGVQHPTDVSKKLFGDKADHEKIKSFHGVTQLIKKHIPAEQHQAIYDKFKASLAGKKDMNHGPALAHMRKHLDVKDTELSEAVKPGAEHFKTIRTGNGQFEVHWKDKKTPYTIFNGSMGASGTGNNIYGIHHKTQGLSRTRGTLQQMKKTLIHSLNKDESKANLTEETEQHAHVAFMGASPHTHMGHHIDVVGGMGSGNKFVGLSGKSDVFSDKEREDIANKQSGGDAKFKVEKSAGQTVGRAFNSMSGSGKKVLHLHFGHDRKEMAERLKGSIEAGKIPELAGNKPDEVKIHYPKDENRSHGMSGTKMRTAAETNDLGTYKKHLGSAFSDKEAKNIMDKTRIGLMAGKIKIKR